ncbi:hypothetical protein ACFY7H_00905 [Streptomyces sp. NPDC012794]|uniref:hypothetical protein n=1 Tax=Streptomyces sp. NPDC012794 TaxID=3364850 RepID=UPI0036CEC61F
MDHGEGEDALVLKAQTMLAAGQSEEEVFAEPAARTGDSGACVVAVRLALGVPLSDAEARLREVERRHRRTASAAQAVPPAQ